MKKLLSILSMFIIILIANAASADVADIFYHTPEESAYLGELRDLKRRNIKLTVIDDKTILMNMKLNKKCEYTCYICKYYDDIRPSQYNELTEKEKQKYEERIQAIRDGNPKKEDIIKKFSGTYDGINDIVERFKYKSPAKGQSTNYTLIIKYEVTHKETNFGLKKLENPESQKFELEILITKDKDGVDEAIIFPY